MDATTQLNEGALAQAMAELLTQANNGTRLKADAHRLAFADPEFLFRRETRGIRFQLEMLKPDLDQAEQGIDNTIVVFGSARCVPPEEAERLLSEAEASGDETALRHARLAVRKAQCYEKARAFARLVAAYSECQRPSDRLYICTGGGPGVMEAANRGAHETGALNVGLNITLPHEQSGNRYITPSLSFKFHYFAMRKMHFLMRAKALVAFPGGFGTLDELFEVLTLVQTSKTQPMPIILMGSDFWSRLINFELLVEEGMISPKDLDLFHLVDEPAEAWELIRAFYKL